ncbi:MAG: hypothetical protein EZS28_006789 [Streblomastix strix]|uniref:Uncharacterized protein n=1 Tax=Streblomastix strix TaxID=222440 RepID=A0A5J4WSA4_9EUKA|nr:MAG: hypothetical protein EZS28_006789 [Streblomastix strix]
MPCFGPDVPHATDWRKSKQYGISRSMIEAKSFQREPCSSWSSGEAQEKERSKKTKSIESLIAQNEPNQGSNAHTQTQTASAVPKPKVTPKKCMKKLKKAKAELINCTDEVVGDQSS